MTCSRLQDTLPCDLNIVFFEFLQSSPSPNTCATQRLGKSLECAWGCLLSLSISILARVCNDHPRCCNHRSGKRQEMMPLVNGGGGGVHQVMALALGT